MVLTSFGEEQRIADALDAGAHGYLLKHIDPDDLLAAIRAAHAGDVPLDPRAGRVLLEQRRRQGRADDLTQARGGGAAARRRRASPTSRSPAASGIGERTVKAHLTSVFQRLGVSDRVQAALWAREHLPDRPQRRSAGPGRGGGPAARRRAGRRGRRRRTSSSWVPDSVTRPCLDDDDAVGVADRRQAVGDDEAGAPVGQVVERREQQLLRRRVEGRRRLVEDDDRGVAQDRPGDRHPLALPAGQVVRRARRGGCRARRAGGRRTRRRARGAPPGSTSRSLTPARPHTRLSRSVPSSSTVSWATIAIWLRRWCSSWSRTSTPSTSTAPASTSSSRGIEGGDRGLAGARRADEGDGLAGLDAQRQVVEHRAAAVGERHVGAARWRRGRRSAGRRGGRRCRSARPGPRRSARTRRRPC